MSTNKRWRVGEARCKDESWFYVTNDDTITFSPFDDYLEAVELCARLNNCAPPQIHSWDEPDVSCSDLNYG